VRGTWRDSSFTGDSKKYLKEGPGNGASLSSYGLHKGNLEGGSFLGTQRHMPRKALEHLSLYRGWREGSYTEDSKRRVIEGSGKGALLFIGAP
jgi:hypothetical protein